MKSLRYDQVALKPRYSEIMSRETNCSTVVEFLGLYFNLPVIPSNMRASISFKQAEWLSDHGYAYILHRFYDYGEIFDWIKNNQHIGLISISVGVKEKDKELLRKIADEKLRVDWVTIDIAHGHSILVKKMIKFIRSLFFKTRVKAVSIGSDGAPKHAYRTYDPKIIAGNVATDIAALDLEDWGADAVKVGIGQGHTCSTRLRTGFGIPMFSCVRDVKGGIWVDELAEDGESMDAVQLRKLTIPIIADGGISQYGDLCKALVAGADMVMAGSMFSRCLDSPAETIFVGDYNIKQGAPYKRWFGSASEENKGERKHVEGFEVVEISNGLSYKEMLEEWKEHLQSGISYAGGNNISCFKDVSYVEIG